MRVGEVDDPVSRPCEACAKRPSDRTCHDCGRSLCSSCWLGSGPAPGYLCSDCEDLEVTRALEAERAECETCNGDGWVERRRHRSDCRCVIRRDPSCEHVIRVRCPRCAADELGEDLIS